MRVPPRRSGHARRTRIGIRVAASCAGVRLPSLLKPPEPWWPGLTTPASSALGGRQVVERRLRNVLRKLGFIETGRVFPDADFGDSLIMSKSVGTSGHTTARK